MSPNLCVSRSSSPLLKSLHRVLLPVDNVDAVDIDCIPLALKLVWLLVMLCFLRCIPFYFWI